MIILFVFHEKPYGSGVPSWRRSRTAAPCLLVFWPFDRSLPPENDGVKRARVCRHCKTFDATRAAVVRAPIGPRRMLAAAVAFCLRNRIYWWEHWCGALSAGRAALLRRRGCCVALCSLVAAAWWNTALSPSPSLCRGFSGGGVACPWRLRRRCGWMAELVERHAAGGRWHCVLTASRLVCVPDGLLRPADGYGWLQRRSSLGRSASRRV